MYPQLCSTLQKKQEIRGWMSVDCIINHLFVHSSLTSVSLNFKWMLVCHYSVFWAQSLNSLSLFHSVASFFTPVIPKVTKHLLSNPVFTCIVLAACMEIAVVAGFAAFLGKYLEQQFNLTTSSANQLLGVYKTHAVDTHLHTQNELRKSVRMYPFVLFFFHCWFLAENVFVLFFLFLSLNF